MLRLILLVSVVLAIGYALYAQRDSIAATLRTVSLGTLVLSQIAVLAGQLLATYSWLVVVDALGPAVGVRRGFQINLVGSLGKYLPGSLWAYLLQMELGRKAGMSRTRILAATVVQVALSVVAALICGLLALPAMLKHGSEALWLFCLLPVTLVGMHPAVLNRVVSIGMRLMKRPAPEMRLGFRTVVKVIGILVACYSCYGVQLWLLAGTQGHVGFTVLLLCTGATAVGMVAGIVAFLLPSGIGAREVVVIAALSTVMLPARAVALAIASRVLFTVGDVLTAGGAALWAWRARGDADSWPESRRLDGRDGGIRPLQPTGGGRGFAGQADGEQAG